MVTLFQLQELTADATKLRQFLTEYGFLARNPPASCPKCAGPLSGAIIMHRNKEHWRCMRKGCQKWVPVGTNSLLEGSKLSPQQVLFFFYFWAHDCGSNRISAMLGIAPSNVALWTARLQTCVANAEEAQGIVLGGRGKEVECDETEIGRRQKGTGGHKKVVKGDVWGAVERGGLLVLEDYDKIKKGPDWERRFGPPGGDDGLDVLCSQYIKRGSILYTDGARVYEQISKKLGFSHDYVDHQENEFAKDANIQGKKRRVHTNSIDGRWGILKNWIRNRGGVNSEHLFQNLKEFQWRQNLQQRDPFITLCEHVRDGYFPF